MKSKFTIGARLSLVLSLAIASFLVANGAQAESGPEQQAKKDLSRTITELVELGADRQWLVEAALNRATTTQDVRQTLLLGAVPRPSFVRSGALPSQSNQQRRR
jgi:hypothetical protein